MDDVRVDKWLWAARFFKTRSLAAEAIDIGRIEVNEERSKRSRLLRVGDVVKIRRPPFEHVVRVVALSETRGPASAAQALYEETEESLKTRERLASQLRAMGPPPIREGRPTKKERRETDRWRGRN